MKKIIPLINPFFIIILYLGITKLADNYQLVVNNFDIIPMILIIASFPGLILTFNISKLLSNFILKHEKDKQNRKPWGRH